MVLPRGRRQGGRVLRGEGDAEERRVGVVAELAVPPPSAGVGASGSTSKRGREGADDAKPRFSRLARSDACSAAVGRRRDASSASSSSSMMVGAWERRRLIVRNFGVPKN